MLDMHGDLTAAFGCHIVQTEPDDLLHLKKTATESEIASIQERILETFDTPDPVSDPITTKLTAGDLRIAAHVAVALKKFVVEKQLDGLACYYEGQEGNEMRELVTNLIVGNSMLTAAGFPMCGESDLKTLIAMLIMDRLDIGISISHPSGLFFAV